MAEVTRYVTPPFRMSFPNLFEKDAMDENSVPKYGLTAVWTPSTFTDGDKKKWKALLAALDAKSREAFKKPWKDLRDAGMKTGIRDGSKKEGLEGFGKGTRFANLTTKMRPGVVDASKNKISPEEGNDDEIYPGCWARATVTVYSYDNKGKGVALGLMNVQKIKDGPRLDSRTDAAEDFEEDLDSAWLEEGEDDLLPEDDFSDLD